MGTLVGGFLARLLLGFNVTGFNLVIKAFTQSRA